MENDFHMENSRKNWLAILQAHGYRITASRKIVVDIIADSKRALSPMDLFEMARVHHSGLGLVTIYRTLEKLEELGLIQRVHRPQGCQAFIAAFHGHQHMLLCSNCGDVEFFDGDNLEGLFSAIAEKTGFFIQEHWLQCFGLCSNCRELERI